jgi:hypothetical protein
MQLIETDIRIARRPLKKEASLKIARSRIIVIEQELERLNRLFSVAGCMISEHDVRTLFHLKQIKDQLELKLKSSLQKQHYRSNTISSFAGDAVLGARLLQEISSLRSRIDKLKSKLFKTSNNNRYVL